MNCSNATDQSSINSKLREFTQITFWLLCVLFLLFCVYPLFKLVRERTALYILVSKLFPDLLFLFSKILSYPLVIRFVSISQNARQNMTMFSLVNNRLHIIALAANRAYALLLPILYSHKITKKCILLQCVLLHLLSFLLTPFYIFLSHYSWTYLTYLGVSSSFYVAIAIRLAWIKAHNRSGNASQSVDKNSGRITATCFAIQILAIVFTMTGVASNYDWYNEFVLCHPIGQILSYPLQFVISLYPISDELLLLVLCKDMRDLFKRIIGKVLAFVKKRNLPKTTPVQKMSTNVTKYDNRMPKSNANRVTYRRAMPPVEKITH
ncbi:hypothetical protein niasHS_007701 [Heterodera schachtii]|uniref:Serpentine receptor class gamma n=1 Tax=Heterodera schachtii TaxID=97005 RepID=A0ABD2JPE0_HETSC